MARLAGIWLCGACLLACDRAASGELAICDPFVAEQQPTELHAILAAGRAADGTLYIVDDDAEHRRQSLFVSDGDGIRLVEVAGGGGGGGEMGEWWSFGVVAHEPPFTLVVTRVDEVIRMGVLVGDADAELFVIGEVGEVLEAVDHDEVLALSVYNIVTSIAPEYVARTADGRTLAVLGPDPAENYDHYRLFLGSDELVEHVVASFAREQDGGTTTIEFDVGGEAPGIAHFPTPFSPELPATLSIDGATDELTTIDASALDGAVYRCLAR